MPSRGVWVYNPHRGGKSIPEQVKRRTEERVGAFVAEHFAGRNRDLAIRFRGQFFYVDALVDPGPRPVGWSGPDGETRRSTSRAWPILRRTCTGFVSMEIPTGGPSPFTATPPSATSPRRPTVQLSL
jgi:hypothetical protein